MPAAWPTPRVVYTSRYNIGAFGLERLHPFDSRKSGRTWNLLKQRVGKGIERFRIRPRRPATRDDLLRVHTAEYLDRLKESRFVARALEVPQLRRLPGWASDWLILRPMRWAVMGSILAGRAAMEHGLGVNLSGGYHHASPDDGHGFSAYADAGLVVEDLRRGGQLKPEDKVVYVDLDAHQGNGVCRTFMADSRTFIFDQYNRQIFPLDLIARPRIDCDVPMKDGCSEADYLAELKGRLPVFLDSVCRSGAVRLAIYNAGTDVYVDDELGGMLVSEPGVLERDRFVLEELIGRGLPTLVLLSGGYSRASYRLIANMVEFILRRWGGVDASPLPPSR